MHVGFIGTREGMTEVQQEIVYDLLAGYASGPSRFHDGDCVGSDNIAHTIAYQLGYYCEIHPPINQKHVAE